MIKARAGSAWKAIAIFAAGAVFGILAAYQVVPASKAGDLANSTGDAATTGSSTTGGTGGGTTTDTSGTGTGNTTGTATGGTTATTNSSRYQCSRRHNSD